jgi:iron complex transport system ATP-binding protein
MATASPSLNASALEVSDATVPGRLEGVSVQIRAGALVGLVGPNGSGKSTLLQVAAGVLPARGRVAWSGRALEEIPILERGRRTAWTPQDARFEFGFTVRAVIAQGRFAHGDDEQGVDEAIARFDLAPLAHRPVNQLSGGERQRVLLARALATAAPLQLWDEPLAAFDVRHALEVLKLAGELTRAGTTVVFSLHDLRVAHCLDEVIVLHKRRVRAAGRPDAVLSPELLHEVFGVRMRTAPGLTLELW